VRIGPTTSRTEEIGRLEVKVRIGSTTSRTEKEGRGRSIDEKDLLRQGLRKKD
jgi:hypothetical protein